MMWRKGVSVYRVRRPLYVPVAAKIACLAAFAAGRWSWQPLTALPFIWIGAWCAAPNGNLVNGCLAYVAMFSGMILFEWRRSLSEWILAGSMLGFYGGMLEQYLCMEPLIDETSKLDDESA